MFGEGGNYRCGGRLVARAGLKRVNTVEMLVLLMKSVACNRVFGLVLGRGALKLDRIVVL